MFRSTEGATKHLEVRQRTISVWPGHLRLDSDEPPNDGDEPQSFQSLRDLLQRNSYAKQNFTLALQRDAATKTITELFASKETE